MGSLPPDKPRARARPGREPEAGGGAAREGGGPTPLSLSLGLCFRHRRRRRLPGISGEATPRGPGGGSEAGGRAGGWAPRFYRRRCLCPVRRQGSSFAASPAAGGRSLGVWDRAERRPGTEGP